MQQSKVSIGAKVFLFALVVQLFCLANAQYFGSLGSLGGYYNLGGLSGSPWGGYGYGGPSYMAGAPYRMTNVNQNQMAAGQNVAYQHQKGLSANVNANTNNAYSKTNADQNSNSNIMNTGFAKRQWGYGGGYGLGYGYGYRPSWNNVNSYQNAGNYNEAMQRSNNMGVNVATSDNSAFAKTAAKNGGGTNLNTFA
ncbi:hypothetical protein BZG36_02212 [Bifiguratus adelaidae]|uniref:Uncharacterized protein n=1 Tax=Bifiguratus adelaidae TaxID=1938954 RepID=A0A261Y3L1_9FUNG|nr:hypothetical protein BZG36_02212 [Bifiguratus adelaidae]